MPGRGRLLEFALPARPATPAATIAFTVLADKLDRPLGLARGPDGKIWIGEAGRISRVGIGAVGAPVKLEPVIDGLASSGAHPLKEIAFGANGRLYFNLGSATDACRDDAGKQPVPCPEVDGPAPRAAVWEATLGPAPAFALQGMRPFARGLRNSVALAFVPGPDVLLQGENSIDYGEEAVAARGAQRPARWRPLRLALLHRRAGSGARLRRPLRLQADRGAGAALAGPCRAAADARGAGGRGQPLRRPARRRLARLPAGGHRIVGQALDAKGRPQGAPKIWVDGWTAQKGVRPLGAPTGIAVDSAGRLLIVEDRHKTLLMLARESP